MPGLVPGIHFLSWTSFSKQNVDGRDNPGDDEESASIPLKSPIVLSCHWQRET